MKKQCLIIVISILLAVANVLVIGLESSTQTQTLKAYLQPEITIFSPLNNNIYNSRGVLIDIVTYYKSTIFLIDGKKILILCKDCTSYHKERYFDEGSHNLSFRITFKDFDSILFDVNNFTVDSKKPIIKSTEPSKGFADGTFKIEFEEANPASLILNYGNNLLGYSIASLDLNQCTENRYNTKKCSINLNLSKYNQQDIIYWFSIRDMADRVVESKIRNLKVDFSKPIIELFNYTIGDAKYRNRVNFYLKINEINFDKVIFIDWNSNYPMWRTLCSSLDKSICSQTRIFSKGQHNVGIMVLDKAGNHVEEKINFNV